MSQYAVIIERAEDGGYGAYSPDVPGCVALGDTAEEALREYADALRFHFEGLREDGLPIPEPSSRIVSVTSVDAA
ncbi:MAG: type II toxin-antitoxin system HicB family antitoxin [Micromonosporaceae bacterium]